jgi:hypothetical protein
MQKDTVLQGTLISNIRYSIYSNLTFQLPNLSNSQLPKFLSSLGKNLFQNNTKIFYSSINFKLLRIIIVAIFELAIYTIMKLCTLL